MQVGLCNFLKRGRIVQSVRLWRLAHVFCDLGRVPDLLTLVAKAMKVPVSKTLATVEHSAVAKSTRSMQRSRLGNSSDYERLIPANNDNGSGVDANNGLRVNFPVPCFVHIPTVNTCSVLFNTHILMRRIISVKMTGIDHKGLNIFKLCLRYAAILATASV